MPWFCLHAELTSPCCLAWLSSHCTTCVHSVLPVSTICIGSSVELCQSPVHASCTQKCILHNTNLSSENHLSSTIISKVVALSEHKTVHSMHTAEAALSAIGTEGCVCNPWMAAKGRCTSKQYCIIVYSSQTMTQWSESERHPDEDSAYFHGYLPLGN